MSNEDRARIMGGELVISYIIKNAFMDGLDVKPGFFAAYCMGDSFDNRGSQWDITSSGDPVSGIPPASIKPNVRCSYMSDGYNCFLEFASEISLKKTRLPAEASESAWSNEEVDAYALFNITAGIRLFDVAGLDELKFNLAVNNITDRKYYPFGSYIPGKGRDIRLFMSMAI